MRHSPSIKESWLGRTLVLLTNRQSLIENQPYFYQYHKRFFRNFIQSGFGITHGSRTITINTDQSYPVHQPTDNATTTPGPYAPWQNKQMNRHEGETYQAPLPLSWPIFYMVY
jgi:hypothetical protein